MQAPASDFPLQSRFLTDKSRFNVDDFFYSREVDACRASYQHQRSVVLDESVNLKLIRTTMHAPTMTQSDFTRT